MNHVAKILIKIVRYICNPKEFLCVLLNIIAPLIKNDESFIKMKWKLCMDYPLNLENPQTYNEKIQWLKLYDHNPDYIKMVDKIEAKKHVASILGEEYIIPTLYVYDSVEEIDFEKLPNQFVMKCSHDSGGVVICKDKEKLDKNNAFERIRKGLKTNYFYQNREWPYKNVKPRIIIEEYKEDESGYELKDYKFFCINGKCEFFKIDFDRQKSHHANYFNRTGVLMPFGEASCPPDNNRILMIPSNLNEMINKAEQIAYYINNTFVRVDLYNINGQVYFGEITFYPASGIGRIEPEEWDKVIGEMIILPYSKLR